MISIDKNYPLAPVWAELGSDGLAPLDVFLALKRLSRQCFILDSAEENQNGRYTFLGFDPKLGITCQNGEITVRGGAEYTVKTADPNAEIRKILERHKSPRVDSLPPFTGGLVGYFAYDYIRYAEPTLKPAEDDSEGFRDIDLMLFDKVIAFDNFYKKLYVIVNIKTDDAEENRAAAEVEIAKILGVIENGARISPPPLSLKSAFSPLFSEQRYCEMVEAVKHHIREGDIFQAVLSNRLDAPADGSLFGVYKILRQTNPSPYMFYFSGDDVEIAGAAPETLVKLENTALTTFPLAGTRPRGKTPEEDAEIERELLSDAKELAEHCMLVDLGRNDIGKISEFGSVSVPEYLKIVRFSHVTHIASTVTGTIRPDRDGLDAIAAVLPAGTLSGAPKIRACEIINALEGDKRGIYGGGIGYLSFSGDADLCIAIRTAYKKNGRVFIRAGAGIVADSVPEKEYAECYHKLGAVINAIEKAGETA